MKMRSTISMTISTTKEKTAEFRPATADQMDQDSPTPAPATSSDDFSLAGSTTSTRPTSVVNPPDHAPTKAAQAESAKHEADVVRQHRATVTAEIAALDRHAKDVDAKIEHLSPMSTPSFTLQELHAERRQLIQLRQMLEADMAAGPITKERNGREISDRDQALSASGLARWPN